jgi:hypothetical protein
VAERPGGQVEDGWAGSELDNIVDIERGGSGADEALLLEFPSLAKSRQTSHLSSSANAPDYARLPATACRRLKSNPAVPAPRLRPSMLVVLMVPLFLPLSCFLAFLLFICLFIPHTS